MRKFQNDGICFDPAGMFYQIKLPSTTRFYNFGLVIPTFVKETAHSFVSDGPWVNHFTQQVQIGQCACGNKIRGIKGRRDCFNPLRMNGSSCPSLEKSDSQKGRLFPVALDKIHPPISQFAQQDCGDDAGKTASASEVRPDRW